MGFGSPFLHTGLMLKWGLWVLGSAEVWWRTLVWTLVHLVVLCIWLRLCWENLADEEDEEDEKDKKKEKWDLGLSTSLDCWSKKM